MEIENNKLQTEKGKGISLQLGQKEAMRNIQEERHITKHSAKRKQFELQRERLQKLVDKG